MLDEEVYAVGAEFLSRERAFHEQLAFYELYGAADLFELESIVLPHRGKDVCLDEVREREFIA